MRFLVTLAAALALSGAWGCRRTSPPDEDSTKPPPPPSPLSQAIEIEAEYSTAQLSNDPDDPAIWVHPGDPARSLIIGTMKVAAPAGALLVCGMDGQIRQAITGIDRPNKRDVEYGFPLGGRRGDREGIAIYKLPDGTGYIVCTDQLDGDSEYHIYPREGAAGNPHDHSREIAVVRGGADATDGLEISSAPLGPGLPHGIVVAMNSEARNFLVFRWQDVAAAIEPPLRVSGTREALDRRREAERVAQRAGDEPVDCPPRPTRR